MEKVLELIKAQKLFEAGSVVGVACSGGSDSMALLHFLHKNAESLDIEVLAVHIDHSTRENDLRDALFVEEFCKENRIRFYKFKVNSLSRKRGKGLEQACREARYEIFESLKEKGLVDKIALAHHQNDQAETVLLHILRGSGLSGASGMEMVRNNYFVRPFLNTKKDEIMAYIYQNQIPFVEDETNADTTISRNFLRNKILPELKKVWPNVVENLANFASICREDDQTIRSFMHFDAILREKNIIKIPKSYFSYRKSFVKRMILDCFKELGLEEGLEKRHIDLIASFATNSENSNKIDLMQNIQVFKEYEYVTIALKKSKKQVKTEWNFKLGSTKIEDFGSIKVKPASSTQLVVGALLVDGDKIPQTAKWRFARDGDFINKFGSGDKVKLKKFLSDKKVPLRLRSVLPVLSTDNQVFVVANIEISEEMKVDESTLNPLLISFEIKNWV